VGYPVEACGGRVGMTVAMVPWSDWLLQDGQAGSFAPRGQAADVRSASR